VLHPLSSTDVGPSLTGARAGGEVRDHDTVCRTRDGRLLPVTLDAAPHVDGNGKPVGWVVVARTAVGRRPA
jgi:PAS domain-containing protein